MKGIVRKAFSPFFIGALILAGLVGLALFAPWMAPYDPSAIHLEEKRQAPSQAHPLGTDPLGRDVLSRIIFGARVSVLVGLTTVTISLVFGTLLQFSGVFR